MLAARDQENLAHAHQTTAAAKPLNQNIRALHPKTPGNLKTPFASQRHDENQPIEFKGQKTGARPGPSKLDKNSFVTPLAPRNRAPLGAKTTNARANAFKTPALALPIAKSGRSAQKASSVKRSTKSKIQVAQSEPVDADILTKKPAEEPEPEWGYAPPPLPDMPDPPMDFNPQPDPLLRDLPRTLHEYYTEPEVESARLARLKREKEEHQAYLRDQERQMLESDKSVFPSDQELNSQVDAMIAAGPRKKCGSAVETIKARSAAEALSPQSQPRTQVNLPAAVSKPTKASAHKMPGALGLLRPSQPTTTSLGARTTHADVSKNTIGFPRARKAPSIIPRSQPASHARKPSKEVAPKVDQASIHPRDFRDLYGSPPVESDMWFRLKEYELVEDSLKDVPDVLADDLFETDFFPFDNSKLDDEDFQLPMPE